MKAGTITLSLFAVLSLKLPAQDSLCYAKIDDIVKIIPNFPCKILDTGNISLSEFSKFRDCYITDSSGKELRAIITFVKDSSYRSEYLCFFFYNNTLIKVETAFISGSKKMGLKYYYYTQGNCQPFDPDPNYNLKRLHYLRLSGFYISRWKK